MIGQILSLVRLGAATQVENKEETDIVELLKAHYEENNAQFENNSDHKTAKLTTPDNIPKLNVNSQLIL